MSLSLPETPSAQAGQCTRHKHNPPDEQLQGGSWRLDTVTGTYHMLSSTVRDGQMIPSPADPSVYDFVYTVAVELARTGDYSLLGSFSPPESYLEPDAVPESFTPIVKVKEKLCVECSIIVDRLHVEITLAQSPGQHPVHAGYGRQLDMNIKPSIDELSRSARNGCGLCAFMFRALEVIPTYRLERHIRASGSRDFPIQVVGHSGEQYWLVLWFRNPQQRGLYGRTKAFEMCATIPRDPAKYPKYMCDIGIRLSHHFLSDTTTKYLRLWLGECINEHAICNAYRQQNSGPPTRLIDVGDAFHEPRLVELSHENRVDYLTLSYCWGKSWNSRTTQASFEKHKVGISMEELSPTIRHAVLLTRHLEMQYLWVDSLCIIQDSKDDWDAESVKMADIYRNSILTIAAPSARSSMEGILPNISERQLPLSVHSEMTSVPLYIDSVPLGWDACIEESPLSDRAWVLQERLLSCRTLFFSSQQMFWECKTKRASQYQYSNLAEDKELKLISEEYGLRKMPKLGPEHRLPLQIQEDDEKHKYLTWYQMIHVYSSKKLTVPSDKLPAIAGIAQAFEPRKSIYIAGIWMNDWLGGLLWEPVTSKSLKQPQNLDYPRAPSWSWARLDGSVSFPFTSPDHNFSEKLRAGVPEIGEASLADKVNPIISDNKAVEGSKGKEAETNEGLGEMPTIPLPANEGVPNTADKGTTISIQVDQLGGPAGMVAKLLDVGHKTSDFMGKETSITLTIRGYAEEVIGISSTASLEPPSTLNDWTGTYNELTGNWSYRLDQEGLEEPFKCLRLIMCATTRCCWALLLRQRPDSHWERIGTGTADSFLVDFSKLAEAPKKTLILY